MKGLNITYSNVPAAENQYFYHAYFINVNWFRLRFYCFYLNIITELHCFLLSFHCKINRQILVYKIKINKTMTYYTASMLPKFFAFEISTVKN